MADPTMFPFTFYSTDGTEIASIETETNSVRDALNALFESGVDLSDANLQNLSLDGLQACGARLCRADMSMCSLQNADFREARLQGTRFSFANLTGSNFTGAGLDGDTDWTGAELIDTINEDYQPVGDGPDGTVPSA